MTYSLFTDGGSRGNPGPGAIGVVIENDKGETIYELSKYIGKCTNNEAEYLALIAGLKVAENKKLDNLEVYIDSELVTKQVNGEYKVKSPNLKKYYVEAANFRKKFDNIDFIHVKRHKNTKADKLVNEALDSNGF
ncbi:ribonuclease HI family protein [Patescibacteria group bacterium]